MSLPKISTTYQFFLFLTDTLDTTAFKSNPTIAAGDFQISKDGGAFTNLATLPVVLPPASESVLIDLTVDEMTANKVTILGKDVAGAEWLDIAAFIDIPSGNVDTVTDILEGDHIENSTTLVINKKGTEDPVLNKQITGSLLQTDIEIRTEEAP